MNFELTIAPSYDIKADLEIIIVVGKNLDHRFIKDKKVLKRAGFKATQDEVCLLASVDRLYVGASSLMGSDIRSASACAIRSLCETEYKSIKISSYLFGQKCTNSLRAMVEGLILGGYSFEKYKSKPNLKKIKSVIISLDEYGNREMDIEKSSLLIEKAQILADATNFARDIVNTPPEDYYPTVMADMALALADECGLDCKILKTKELKKEKMETLLAVARASRHRPRVIHLSHKPQNPKCVVSFVGKGLTYDSGGLSLKPSDFMATMKSDKSGGSAVMGIMKAVSDMGLPIEVHGFIGAVENMIGGDAYKPDDVLVAKNGKTIEVKNTDAEGRLVLADVLCYAQQEVEADYIIDLATLTGASVVGVGHYTSSVMANSDKMKALMVDMAKRSGELATSLDFNPYLKKTIKSKIADMSNISNTRYGGAITAGLFLSEFIEKKNSDKWAHIDIAGPAFVEHTWGENPFGASGAGVRMMVKFIENLSLGEHK